MTTDRNAVLNRFQAKKSYMEDRISSGIESGRKGFVTLKIADAAKKPAADARVKVPQRSHDFRYDANLFMLGGFDSPEKNWTYETLFADFHFGKGLREWAVQI